MSVDLHPGDQTVEFGGPLEFVNKLREIIPSNGFTDPPSLSVTPSGIAASYSLSLPSIGVGIFALEHVSLGAGFALPFDGKPAEVRFNFSERQRPFSLTVSLLGRADRVFAKISAADADKVPHEDACNAFFTFANGISATLTFWPSEFSQLRGQLRRTKYGDLDKSVTELLMQLQFSIGAHGAHSF